MSRHLNIARVVIDSPLPHLDRLFDYEIPEELSETCQPGTKVKVKFSNRNMEAWVVDRTQLTSHHKKLAPISKVISNYPVLTPDVFALCQVVADHFLGNLCDVLRFAIPPRQAKIEKNHTEISKITKNEPNDNFSLSSITFPPRLSFEQEIMQKIEKQKKANKQSLVMFPNITLVEDFVQKIKNSNSDINVRILSAEQEAGVRYQAFLDTLRQNIDVVVGTRNAVFSPLSNLGLIAIWDDADENYFSPQSPYWNAREVAITRAKICKCEFIAFGKSESIAVNELINQKQIDRISIQDYQSNKYWPQVLTLDNSTSDPTERVKRIPSKAWQVIKDGLENGNVLIQVPRLGYSSNLQCSNCKESARCVDCNGPLILKQKNSAPECKWCARIASKWKCKFCVSKDFRITVIGQTKTVEELGKSFPGVKILTSGGSSILRQVDTSNSIIVATPGAEPKEITGYSAAVLLDAYLLLGVPSLAATEECLRKWINLFSLVKPQSEGGKVYITSDSTNRVVQSLIKRDPNWLIDSERKLRHDTKLHPSLQTISLKGDLVEISQLNELFKSDEQISILGPRIFEKEELAQIVIATPKVSDTLNKIRAEIIKFSAARTKPVRAHVNAYDID